ncbi:MAG: hypothetical protein XD60_0864 [Acetothermia bacterium 64_32]|nr:MAG: hypothetical protein XD60_0864 [Acetothermia bacterium 64_32]
MKPINPWEGFVQLQENLEGNGVFLVSVDKEGRANPMTIGWGLLGTVWRRPVFLVLVRPSRFTHHLIEESGGFAVCVPKKGELCDALGFCGTHSGRQVDKVRELGLELLPGRKGRVPLLAGCAVHYECRVVAQTRLAQGKLFSPEIQARYYPEGDLHTLFFGEILAAWRAA